MRGATGNNRFVDIRIDRDFFAKIAGGSHPMRAAGLQIDGHADHVAATWFGIAYQSLKFQIGIFSNALVLHADIQTKRARCFSGLQIIPLSEVAAKDEFLNIKNVSRDDMMAAHRVPPQMMGIMPNNVGGFGDVEKASKVFVRNELLPLQKRLQEINNFIEEGVIEFQEYHF